ncbi:GFA family protein [Dokdonella sp.]|uniref:GFA family protein n=1 Tax=Dokdonella sp. TaxID=2291710 RepID=UPI003529189E
MAKGSCLCGAVSFEFDLAREHAPDACHCSQCRKHSGHYFASTNVPRSELTIHGQDSITWYRSSEQVRRGFCRICGSSLFWDPDRTAHAFISVAMGALEAPTGLKLARHIFVADKGDYYDIADGLPQYERY